GGFPHDEERKKQFFKHVALGTPHYSAAPETNTGDGLKLAESVGASVCQDLPWAGALAPVSLIPRLDGTLGRFPHLVERGKPGLIAVLPNGKRFTNEGDSYPAFVKDLLKHTTEGALARCWLICDHKFFRDLPWAGALAPVSLIPRLDGTLGRFPHLVERGKPGLIAVLPNGKRFTNEGDSYPAFVKDLLKHTTEGALARCWLICDHKFI